MRFSFLFLLLGLVGCQIYPKADKIEAYEQCLKLKDGILLIKLDRKIKKIEALKALGKDEEALLLEKETASTNLILVNGFINQYYFSDVLFFYSDQLAEVKLGKWDEIVFLGKNLVPVNTLTRTMENYFIGGLQQSSRMDGVGMVVYGLVITDKELNQLKAPFPAVTKCNEKFYKDVPLHFINRFQESLEALIRRYKRKKW